MNEGGEGEGESEGIGRPAPRPLTHLAQAGRRAEWTSMPGQPGGIVNPPVWRASTILYDDVAHLKAASGRDPHERLFYGRKGTPTAWSLADALTSMEPGAKGTMLFPSGVAAIACSLMAVLKPGDQLLMVDAAYDPTRGFCERMLKPLGIETIYYDPTIGADIAALFTDRTKAIFLESPGSLTFEVQDIPAITALARARDIVTLMDNTWATPLYFQALAKGVDISIVACTKYIVGHSDVMIGSATATPELWPALRSSAYLFGQMTSPDDAWLAARGLRTLGVRLAQHQAGALQVAQWLADRPEVARVLHPALPGCSGHDIWLRDFSGSTGLFTFILNGGGDKARAALIDGLAHFGIGYSWGGFESLALPVDPARYRSATRWEAEGPAIRLHIGLEDPADLITDLDAGLARFRASA
ncbi:cystathionine beta-lyase [Sphingobium phenoxybenzoativorans]|uniref:Cystathionine beta-lyase n=1 Tax=Sphingobium phenoxybenzoativorans TaxID=1592790 RepID=A0A975K8P2_9SPHN|nr:cystathionine beta-lyase [Sphingobium phenoxybenzoativorans]QUT06527.1 cystathionine beta-lyase [Sphingobium phenoxybenzoativorans]